MASTHIHTPDSAFVYDSSVEVEANSGPSQGDPMTAAIRLGCHILFLVGELRDAVRVEEVVWLTAADRTAWVEAVEYARYCLVAVAAEVEVEVDLGYTAVFDCPYLDDSR